jgi:putative PEP-CTERM system histidine kinase
MDPVSILALAAVAACLASGIAALVRARRRPGHVAFGVGAIAAAAWLFAAGSVRVSPTASVAVLRARVACALAAMLPLPWTVLLLVQAREGTARILREWRPYLIVAACASIVFVARSLDGSVLFGVAGRRGEIELVFGQAGRAMLVYLLATSVVLFFSLEVTLRAARPESYARIKHAAIGLAVAMAYHMFVLAVALLYSRVGVSLLVGGAAPALAAVALVWLSVTRKAADVSVRIGRPVFYASFTAFAAGAYLLAAGLVGLVARARGWSLSTVPLVAAVSVGVLLLLVLFSSARVRRAIRRFVDSNFYLSRHDYRREWAQASRALATSLDETEVAESLCRLVSDALDVGGVRVALAESRGRGARFFGGADFGEGLAAAVSDGDFLRVLAEQRCALRISGDVDRDLAAWARRHSAAVARSGCELAGPLFAGADLVGVVLVGPRRGGVHSAEDLDLLSTIGFQAGNALLAARLASELAEGRELETIHRLSTFVVHDLKNCITGLSMLLRNAQSRMEDPAFRSACLDGIAESIASMERIVARVGTAARRRADEGAVGLADAVREAINGAGVGGAASPVRVRMSVPEELLVGVGRGDLALVLRNLLANSREAMGGAGEIDIHAQGGAGGDVVVRMTDSGPGIPAHLLENGELFRPFRTTKDNGLGLGLYHCRSIVEGWGGAIRASNGPRGALFEIVLPRAERGRHA